MKFSTILLPLFAALTVAAPTALAEGSPLDISTLSPEAITSIMEATKRAISESLEKRNVGGLERRYDWCDKKCINNSKICTHCSTVRGSYLCSTQAVFCANPPTNVNLPKLPGRT